MPAIALRASHSGIASPTPCFALGPLFAPIRRRRRSSFKAATDLGPYRLPRRVQTDLETALGPFRNAEAAFALATFLGRFWTAPGRLESSFPIDRRALADHPELGLTEGRVRGAILTLERVGFLSRPVRPRSSPYKATETGLQRKPILYAFGLMFRSHFEAANRKRLVNRQLTVTAQPVRPATSSPKSRISESEPKVMIMGQVRTLSMIETAIDPENPLEQALARLKTAIQMP